MYRAKLESILCNRKKKKWKTYTSEMGMNFVELNHFYYSSCSMFFFFNCSYLFSLSIIFFVKCLSKFYVVNQCFNSIIFFLIEYLIVN